MVGGVGFFFFFFFFGSSDAHFILIAGLVDLFVVRFVHLMIDLHRTIEVNC